MADKPNPKAYKLAGNAVQLDVSTQYGTIKVTNKMLQKDSTVAMLQQCAPKVFIKGLIVLA
jgi:hypothetical protein